MMKSSTKSPTITVPRLRSDRTMLGSYIPIVFHRQASGDRSFNAHATTTITITTLDGPTSGTTEASASATPYTNKSDYIYLTQSSQEEEDSSSGRNRATMLVTRFPLDDFDATRALVSHITELMRTTNSVTLKCDFNAYLNNVSISRNLALDECPTVGNVPAAVRKNRLGGGGGGGASYARFSDLLALLANEKTLLKRRAALESQGWTFPRLRLCGGGEDSINNGTSAWGTPPVTASGASAWGIPNQQPPPQAWGGTPGNGGASNSAQNAMNNNNNNQPATAGHSQQRQSSQQPPDHNANKAPQQQQVPNATGGGGTPNAWNRNPTQQQQQQQQQQPTGPNPSMANSNNPQQPPQPQQQQQQVPQMVMANNGNVATKSQLEVLSNMREALFSQDGWGCQHVNQDTNWEVPCSPEPGKVDTNNAAAAGSGPNPPPPTGWKPCNQNNGTELWEANLRNGGQPAPPPQPVQKTPWGPATNIGGTWGEDDDSGEANVWNGGASGNQPPAAPPQAWNQNNPNMWPPGTANAGPNPGAVKKEGEWGGLGVIGANSGAAGGGVPPAVPGWDARGGAAPAVNLPGPVGQNAPIEAVREIRGDPRGISGRLNGNSGMWEQQNVPNLPGVAAKLTQGALPSAGPGNNQWNAPVPNKLPGGWDEATSPMNARPTLDDGPSGLWNQNQLSRQNSNVSNWKDMPDNVARNPMPRTPLGGGGGGGANLPLGPVARGVRLGGMNPGMKPDSGMWGQNQGLPGMNGSWDEPGVSGWDDKGLGGNGPWNDFGQGGNNMWNKGKQGGGGGWPDPSDMMGGGGGDWSMNKPPNKMSPAEIIRSSKQYRMLCENGFKKEDVEIVLRTTNMNFDESLELLQRHSSAGGLGDWRRPDEHAASAFDAPFSNRFPGGHGAGMPFSQNQNLLNNLPGVGGANPNLAALNNLKYLSQGPGGGGGGNNAGHSSFSQQPQGGPNPLAAAAASLAGGNPGGNPQAQLRMLVHQIQMAIQAGFLNQQILNQPLAPQTLLLLNQLLNYIKHMQQMQSNLARSGGSTGVSAVQLTMQINKYKAQISQLQQQITAQQAIFVKQQQHQQQQQQQPGGPHQQPPNSSLGGAADFLRQQDLVSLQSNFGEMGLGKDPTTPTGGFPSNNAAGVGGAGGGGVGVPNATGGAGVTSQQSRLTQWKLPSLDKDGGGAGGANDLTDFSRAPGTTAKSTLSTASANIGSLGLQDGTWSSGRSNLADGWPDQPSSAGDSDNKDWNSSQDNSAFSDLVPEFEPGKPWKGAQMKIDDDPSITPGSVARSPLSIATAKEADLFGGGGGGKTSPTDAMGLGSATWGFNSAQTAGVGGGPGGKLGAVAGKNAWPDSGPAGSADLWGAPMGKTTRGPPPGLGANKNVSAAANGWVSGAAGGPRSGGGNWPGGNGWGSSWLLLKNLTSQIDGSTLRTLCMQHGPLQSLQLYPNHGLALCKYSSREEASKAQQALNNCPLGSSTIGAECPSDAEVQTYIQQLGAPAGSGGVGGGVPPPNSSGGVTSVAQSWRQAPRTAGADTWGSGWPPSGGSAGGSSLWAPLDGANERGTPSNLNSFLPESLLGTELN